jgi:hypothetical protein
VLWLPEDELLRLELLLPEEELLRLELLLPELRLGLRYDGPQ